MQSTDERLPAKHIVLLGIGHTNAHVVRMWGMNPIPDADLTCISDNAIATYSGMLPAVLAGQIPPEEMEIDLVQLCADVGARLIVDEVSNLDVDKQLIQFVNRPAIPFDVLSIGIGSVPSVAGVQVDGDCLLKIKPMQTFLQRLSESVDRAVERRAGAELRIVVAGSGVAGTEITFCLPEFLKTKTDSAFSLNMVTRSQKVLAEVIPSMRHRVVNQLSDRSVNVVTGKSIVRVSDNIVELNDGSCIPADLLIWATGASAPPLLSRLSVPLDDRGFIATNATLQSTSDKPIFAVGDSGTIVTEQLPKAGVFAVRQGPILWNNIQNSINCGPLVAYDPQRSFLKLLNTGDGRAIGEFKGFSFAGHWVMKLKEYIDGKFMRMYRVKGMDSDADPMQCRGCGCKLGGEVLESVLTNSVSGSEVLDLDDAALIDTVKGNSVIASTDFFSSPFEDAFLTGRIAALHSASDVFAMGGNVKAALANFVLPEGDTNSQQRMLQDLTAGARCEFDAMGATIAGGHTIVGPRLEVGFTVIGEPISETAILRKSHLKVGDVLYLTKPLGIGVLLAAQMRSQCRAADYQALIEAMLQPQHQFAAMAVDLGIRAATDITGFGLVGHLIEMLKASGHAAKLNLEAIPLLSGAANAIESGIESTLAPNNRHVGSLIDADLELQESAAYKVLFDPQTCGGLLFGIPQQSAQTWEDQIHTATNETLHRIGVVTEASSTTGLVSLHRTEQ